HPRHLGRGVRPPVPDQLVAAEEEMLMRLALEVHRSGAERWRMHPGPRLRGDDLAPVQVSSRGSPAQLRQLGPSAALTLDQIRGSARAHRDRRLAVSLQAERYSVLAGPVGADGDEVVLDQLGQGAAHVETKPLRTGPGDLQQVQRW